MKARVKATGEIVDIAEYSTIYAENYDTCFYPNELEFLDNSEDYWPRLEHQYAGMAMQGIISSKRGLNIETDMYDIPYYSQMLAHALVKKYKKEE